MIVQERYSPVVVGVNATVTSIDANGLAYFLPQTDGAISVYTLDRLNPQTLLLSFPVNTGAPIPLFFRTNGGYKLIATGGASGLLTVT